MSGPLVTPGAAACADPLKPWRMLQVGDACEAAVIAAKAGLV